MKKYTKNELQNELKKYFGFSTFKKKQEVAINNLLEGNDTFVLMPTGGGKSLIYQLPALISDGIAIIISPLIALMKNQVDLIRSYGNDNSVAHFYNSSLRKSEIEIVKDDIIKNKTKILYIAPESLSKEENIEFYKTLNIKYFAIDEAHCISEWGHDFRPEYRNIRKVIDKIKNVPIIALTATATVKVQGDIMKNLKIQDALLVKSSFNRENLYYEVRPKKNAIKDIVRYIKQNTGKSGIIYCRSRKSVDKVAEVLTINGIKALPYHAGFDKKIRTKNQDEFLMEQVDVIVATIAFGMGIDKPDIRFVMHYDMPKSIEGYYQETGRAGRDGGEGRCIAYYSEKDIQKMEKLSRIDPNLIKQEIKIQLLNEIVNYAENPSCRKKTILNYFGEQLIEDCGNCDNCVKPREKFEGEEQILSVLNTILTVKEKFKLDHIADIIAGNSTPSLKTYNHHKIKMFAIGNYESVNFWKSVIRQLIVRNFIKKAVENFGELYLSKEGKKYVKSPYSIMLSKEREYEEDGDDEESFMNSVGSASIDNQLFSMLKDLRKDIAKKHKLKPYIIFEEPSLEDMTIHYPMDIDELCNIVGVGKGKAEKYGKSFVSLIKKYVEENKIERPQDFIVKTVVNKSRVKVELIQQTDRKIQLDIIAKNRDLELMELLEEIETIVKSGTKINIDYHVKQILEEDQIEDILEYFNEAETDSLDDAIEEFEDEEYTEEELQAVKIKFLSDVAH